MASTDQRPSIHHMTTTPNLVRFRGDEGPSAGVPPERRNSATITDPSKKSAKELLGQMTKRLSDSYRGTQIRAKSKKQFGNPAYDRRVLFDTIDLRYDRDDDPWLDFSDDEPYPDFRSRRRLLNDGDPRGRGRDLFVRSPATSPSTSPTRMLSPNRMDMSAFFRNQIKYPTTPILTRRGCALTRMHRDFEGLYLGRLLNKGLCPVLPRRVILIYISGRQHTWVALDWVLRKFVENGDFVVIASSLPHPLGVPSSGITRFPLPLLYPAKTERVRQRQRNRPEFIKEVAANVMRYALTVVNPKAIVKITVEVAEGRTKDVLKDMYKLYEPNILAVAPKVNMRNSAPLKLWNSLRISDRLVKHSPVPVIVVPALNMSEFEEELSEHISHQLAGTKISTSLSTSSASKPDEQLGSSKMDIGLLRDDELLSDHSLRSDSSGSSELSLVSYSSFDEIADLYNDYRHKLHNTLDKLTKKERDENYFVNFARAISDQSLEFCEELRLVDPDFRGQGAVLARAITGSNSFGAVPYKTKSLLAPVEPPSPTTSTLTPGLSYSELKRNLKMNAERERAHQNSQGVLSINVYSPETSPPPSTTPKPSALRFADGEKPSKRGRSKPLKKFLSHEDSASKRVELQPLKSHPDIRTVLGNGTEAKEKKKKRKFWKLF